MPSLSIRAAVGTLQTRPPVNHANFKGLGFCYTKLSAALAYADLCLGFCAMPTTPTMYKAVLRLSRLIVIHPDFVSVLHLLAGDQRSAVVTYMMNNKVNGMTVT